MFPYSTQDKKQITNEQLAWISLAEGRQQLTEFAYERHIKLAEQQEKIQVQQSHQESQTNSINQFTSLLSNLFQFMIGSHLDSLIVYPKVEFDATISVIISIAFELSGIRTE